MKRPDEPRTEENNRKHKLKEYAETEKFPCIPKIKLTTEAKHNVTFSLDVMSNML